MNLNEQKTLVSYELTTSHSGADLIPYGNPDIDSITIRLSDHYQDQKWGDIVVWKDFYNLKSSPWNDLMRHSGGGGNLDVKIEKATFGNDSAVKRTKTWTKPIEGYEHKSITYFMPATGPDTMVWMIDYSIPLDQDKNIINRQKEITKILSTFHFSNQPEVSKLTPKVTSVTKEEISTWKSYSDSTLGYQLNYPQDWLVEESDHMITLTNKPERVKYITFQSPNKQYILHFGIKRKGEEIRLTGRTGVGGGNPIKGEPILLDNHPLPVQYVVDGGKIKTVLYTPEVFTIGNFDYYADFDFISDTTTSNALDNIDLAATTEMKIANQILSTFKFTK